MSKEEKENPELQLVDSVYLTAEIQCSKCQKKDANMGADSNYGIASQEKKNPNQKPI